MKTCFLVLTMFCLFAPVFAEEVLVLGGEDQWAESHTYNLSWETGLRGMQDLVLADSEWRVDSDTDGLWHFNFNGEQDSAGHYRIEQDYTVSEGNGFMGPASALFQRDGGIKLIPGDGAMFSAGRQWNSFTIEFWMYPAALSENEEVFNWKGLIRKNGELSSQEIRADISRRRLVWQFTDLFTDPDGDTLSFELKSSPLLPRQWHHHQIRFNGETGLLEYCIDGVPQDIVYTNPTEQENRDVFIPQVGPQTDSPINLGASFTGFLDEVRFSTGLRDYSDPGLYSRPGVFYSRIIDLEYPDSEVYSIIPVDSEPGNSRIFYSYAQSNSTRYLEDLRDSELYPGQYYNVSGVQWQTLPDDYRTNSKGRYLMIKAELYPDAASEEPPRLSFLEIHYQEQLPPPPPLNLRAESRDGNIVLSWDKPAVPGITGYMIFYGDRPGEYYQYDPVDAGRRDTITLSGLEKRHLYYFTVAAYSGSEPRQYSGFSNIVAIRP